MSRKPATRSSNLPRRWRRRLLRHHLPLALASAVVLGLFVGLPPFDANRYPHVDIFSGVFPEERARAEAGTMDHAGSQPSQEQGEGHQPPQEQGGDHQSPQEQVEGDTSSLIPSSEEVQDRSFDRRFTVATGYLALALLALTLLIGPANLMLRRRNPVSSYLRRDVGTWTAIFSVTHVIYGLKVHGNGRLSDFLNYFVADGSPLTNSFGLGNWTGLAALVIVAGLLALSSDAALRKLKARNWKRLQRLNYALFALVIAHVFFYGAFLRTDSPYTLLLLLSIIAVFAGQAVGVWLWRRRYARTATKIA
jgi:sulfoxide reductase heme-binding subunit YedZ